MPQPSENAFFRRQIACLEAGDLDGLMAQDADDVVLVMFEPTVRGRAALRNHFVGYLARLCSLRLVSTEKFAASDDAVFFESIAGTPLGVARADDAFAPRDGRATHHFAGVLGFEPRDAAGGCWTGGGSLGVSHPGVRR